MLLKFRKEAWEAIPKSLKDGIRKIGFKDDYKNVPQQVQKDTWRLGSIYTEGEFTLLSNGNILRSYAGFIGNEEKVEYQEEYDVSGAEAVLIREEMV